MYSRIRLQTPWFKAERKYFNETPADVGVLLFLEECKGHHLEDEILNSSLYKAIRQMNMTELDKISNKIKTREDAVAIIKHWEKANETIVFTNGCFDIVHRGHIDYLSKAKDLGTKLILGLNTDASVQRLKGPQRPVVDEQSRAILMAALQFIDLVVFFDEDTPYELIKALQPDVLVKGSDYKAADIVGYDILMAKGGKVKTIDFVEGFSTTSIVEKIKTLM